jgi:hypothetical protein
MSHVTLQSYRVHFGRVRAALPGHEAHRTVKEGAVELAAAYQRSGLTKRDFKRRYTRLPARRADDTLQPWASL